MDRLKNKEFREELAYSILKKFAKEQGWKEYRYDDGFYMFGPDNIYLTEDVGHGECLGMYLVVEKIY